MDWVSAIFIPPTAVVILLWFLSLSTERFSRAWALSYMGQGLGVIAAVLYLAGGDWRDGSGAVFLAAVFLGFRWIFTAEGLHSRFRL